MGKIRYTLTYIIFWFIIVFSCLFVENFALFSSSPMAGFSFDSKLLLSIFVIILLVIYYFLEYKHNQIRFDKILFPIIGAVTLLFIITNVLQGNREFINGETSNYVLVEITAKDKLISTIEIIVWGAVIYGILFTFNRYHLAFKSLKWLLLACVFLVFACTIIDVFLEIDTIKAIFEGTNTGNGLHFILYNSNLWGSTVMVALISTMMLNIKKFNIFYYIIMIYFVVFNIFTSCATTIFISFAVLLCYTFFEIFALFKKDVKMGVFWLLAYLTFLIGVGLVMATLIRSGDNPVANFWKFVDIHVLQADFATFTSRTKIWQAAFDLLKENPRDFVFGLGFKSANTYFTEYYRVFVEAGFLVRSTHNGFVEIMLRHGIVGLILYVGALGVCAYAFVKMLFKKKIRAFFLYGISFGAILTHSMMESTMFLSTNVNGAYLTVVFFVPVISEIQDKKIEKMFKDINNVKLPNKGSAVLSDISTTLSTILFGLFITAIASLTLSYDQDKVIRTVLISLAICSIVLFWFVPFIGHKFKTISQYFHKALLNNFWNRVLIACVLISICSFIFRQSFNMTRFDMLTFSCMIFTIYLLSVTLVNKSELLIAFSYINDSLLSKLKRRESEELNG